MFPKTVSLGGRAVGWVEEEVLDWVQARVEERDAPHRAKGGASAAGFVEGTSHSLPVVQPVAVGFPCFVVGATDQGRWTYSYRYSVNGAGGGG